MQTETVTREYSAWEPLEGPAHPGCRYFVRGDLEGEMDLDPERQTFHGIFEFPVKGRERGFYEVVARQGEREDVLRRVTVRYMFDAQYFAPRWENVDAVNRFIAERYRPLAALEIVYRYARFGRDIQLLRLTDPSVSDDAKQVVFITGRVHNPESGMTTACYRFIRWLLHGDGRGYLKEYLFLIVPLTMPLTFEEDPRAHNVNRLWQPEITAPDLAAVRDRILDRYLPEVWIDCHSFNEILPLDDPNEARRRCGDYVVAHPVGETYFDHPYSTAVALKLIAAAERAGHRHRDAGFFAWWAETMPRNVPSRPGETFVTDHHPAGIFSGVDYARYADRGKFGIMGRDWPAMACDYGYYRCHAVNLCLECKPLHVGDGANGVVHYPRTFPDSHVVKLRELCQVGREAFSGQPFAGFPCQLVAADTAAGPRSVMLCAWGENRREIRQSRSTLWRNRRSICLHTAPDGREVTVECFADITCAAALRFPVDHAAAGDTFVFQPFIMTLGRFIVTRLMAEAPPDRTDKVVMPS